MIQQIDFYKNKELRDLSYFNEEIGLWFTEQWKDVPNYEGLYQISNFGRVKSLKRIVPCKNDIRLKNTHRNVKERILSQSFDDDKYLKTTICKNHIEKCVSIGRLVAIVFNPNPDNLPQINHIGKYPDGREGLKTDNRSISLKWITCKDNIHHSWKNELAKGLKGESHGSAKLTEQQVLNIRSSNLKNIRLAEIYRVSTASISLIKNRKVWKHI